MTDETIYDVAIIGAGPAGLAAAKVVLEAGLSIIVMDEQPRAGGQFLRPPHPDRRGKSWMGRPLSQGA